MPDVNTQNYQYFITFLAYSKTDINVLTTYKGMFQGPWIYSFLYFMIWKWVHRPFKFMG